MTKIDGTGYPQGLKGSEIPFGAKIIAVADFFEAITAKRHYRGPMPIALAIKLLEERSGTHFERKVVKALIAYLKKNDYLLEESDAPRRMRVQRQRRIPCRTPVSFRVNGRTSSGTSTDISSRGMYVAIDQDLEEGCPVELTFTLPNSTPVTIQAKGRIAWVNNGRKPLKPVFPSGFGVEFLNVEPTDEVLQSFVGNYAN